MNSPILMSISLLIGLTALAFSFLHKDLIHLPDHTGRASFRKREEILSLPVLDKRHLPIRFSEAAALIDIEIHNWDEHAIALCSYVTQSKSTSQLNTFERLLPCGNDKKKQLAFSAVEETPQVWSTADTLDTSCVHFLSPQQLQHPSIIQIIAENHNSIISASFSYSITVSIVGPRNPLYWYHWFNQEAKSSKLPFEKLMWNLLAVTKQYTRGIRTYFSYLKGYIPSVSKSMKTIGKAMNPQSCRSIDVLRDVAMMRKACMRFSINEPIDQLMGYFLSKVDFCHSFFSGSLVVGVLASCNVVCYFYFRTDEVATTIIHFGSFKRLFCSIFAHIDLFHLIFNMRMLFLTGSKLTTLLDCDSVLFLWFYVMSGLGGGIVSLLWRRMRGSCNYSAGASGALYGIHATLAVLIQAESKGQRLTRVLLGRSDGVDSTADTIQLIWNIIGTDVLRAVVFGGGHIDTAAHVGGALTGVILAGLYMTSDNEL